MLDSMTNPEGASDPNQQHPDQPYDELDTPGVEAQLEFLRIISNGRVLDDLDFRLLELLANLDNLPCPDFPPGLPPKLRELMEQEGRNGPLPPSTDMPQ